MTKRSRRPHTFRIALLMSLLGRVALPVGAAQYEVTIEASNLRQAKVVAHLVPTAARELLLNRNADDSGIEGGWARFLEDLSVSNSEGTALEVEPLGEGRFALPGATGAVRAQYTMRLEHDRVENLPGADELAWARSDAVLWSGRALFLEGAPSEEIEISFVLPEAWRATTPWRPLELGRRFRAEGLDELLDSAFVVGTHFEARLGDGVDAPVRIALAGPNARSQRELIVATVERYLATFRELLGGPAEGRLLLVAADGGFWGGGVMGTTISMLVGGALDASTLPMLRFVTVHEAFHLWNSNFAYAGRAGIESLYWLSEGTASYYTMRSQLGWGELSMDVVLEQLADEVRKYLAASGDLSMVAAGPEKLSHYNLIYSGGFVASLALDVAIRVRSKGRRSLDDVMSSLHSGASREVPLDVESFAQVVQAATGVSVQDLLDCCIRGGERLSLEETFERLGLTLTIGSGSVRLEINSAAAAEDRARWEAWPLSARSSSR